MTPETAIVIAQLFLKYGPVVAESVATLFSKKEHTLEDWKSVFALTKSYEQMELESSNRMHIPLTTLPPSHP